MNDNLKTLDKMEGERKRKRGRKTERKAEKWRVVEGEKAGLCNRWSWRILTTGEYARLPQSDKWLSCSQTTGPNRKKTIHLQSNSVGRNFCFVREKYGHNGDNGEKTSGRLSGGRKRQRTKTNTQGLWPKAAMSVLVFILGSLLSIWLYELFIGQERVGTTVQLLMKQSFRAAWRENHSHNVAWEKTWLWIQGNK